MTTHIRQQRMWVVFTDHTDIFYLKILRRGFRHCFVLIHDGRDWITVDPLSHHMKIAVQNVDSGFDLPAWLKARGHCVLRARKQEEIFKPAPLILYFCVEVAKRILGIRRRFIITPWQLYCHLQRTPRSALPYSKGVLSWEI